MNDDTVLLISHSAFQCVCVRVSIWNTDLVEAALRHGLQHLIGFLRLMAGYDACWLSREGLATNQHHDIYGFLEEDYFRVFILDRKKDAVMNRSVHSRD